MASLPPPQTSLLNLTRALLSLIRVILAALAPGPCADAVNHVMSKTSSSSPCLRAAKCHSNPEQHSVAAIIDATALTCLAPAHSSHCSHLYTKLLEAATRCCRCKVCASLLQHWNVWNVSRRTYHASCHISSIAAQRSTCSRQILGLVALCVSGALRSNLRRNASGASSRSNALNSFLLYAVYFTIIVILQRPLKCS